MGRIKTISAVSVILWAGAAWAVPQSLSQRVQLFATCAGRYSALLEFQLMFDGHVTDEARSAKEQFEELLEAVLPIAVDDGLSGHAALDWRLTAKHAQSTLLHRGLLHHDAVIARQSKTMSKRLLRQCGSVALEI